MIKLFKKIVKNYGYQPTDKLDTSNPPNISIKQIRKLKLEKIQNVLQR